MVGCESLRAILIHPQLELVGVYVYSKEKAGTDAGDLRDMPAVGVAASNDIDDILALEADCVMYAPRHADVDEVCALLSSGKNVAATPFLFHRKSSYSDDRDKIEAACKAGNSTVHGTGIHPGFLGMVLPVALSAGAPTITWPAEILTAGPKWSPAPGAGFSRVSRRSRVSAEKM